MCEPVEGFPRDGIADTVPLEGGADMNIVKSVLTWGFVLLVMGGIGAASVLLTGSQSQRVGRNRGNRRNEANNQRRRDPNP